ncbi:DinB family protein [Chelativorans salis]|uniref:DinB family protein n=1 Tax=Chelativorans salis TaxID=2978478 RepID=A0ABT2LMY1_9HYPH|nr:DinB family protein [Chelativorans sp. EGI FJ00035]MCT7375921.1 DinB family protein [Chelativorans sp. EGI FJ00035]
MKRHFEMMAAYNRWANGLLYEAAAGLSAEEYARDVGAFFKSMVGTLNHILVADRIWMKRFTGKGGAPARLDAILHPALPSLKQAREAEDERVVDWIAGLDEKALQGRFTYMTVVNPRTISQRLAPALTHFFNHQTHHRGQAHMILSVLGKEPPSLDMIYFHRTPEGREFS